MFHRRGDGAEEKTLRTLWQKYAEDAIIGQMSRRELWYCLSQQAQSSRSRRGRAAGRKVSPWEQTAQGREAVRRACARKVRAITASPASANCMGKMTVTASASERLA